MSGLHDTGESMRRDDLIEGLGDILGALEDTLRDDEALAAGGDARAAGRLEVSRRRAGVLRGAVGVLNLDAPPEPPRAVRAVSEAMVERATAARALQERSDNQLHRDATLGIGVLLHTDFPGAAQAVGLLVSRAFGADPLDALRPPPNAVADVPATGEPK